MEKKRRRREHPNDQKVAAIIPSWMGRSTLVGPFRPSQSFTVSGAHHLVDKLRWDIDQLESMQLNAALGKQWRQAVSFKAIDCSMSAWHLAEWFARDTRAIEPRARVCAFLGMTAHDPEFPIDARDLQDQARVLCPDLDICRVIALASKHYDVEDDPRPDIHTAVSERWINGIEGVTSVMTSTVQVDDQTRPMLQILRNALLFWEQLRAVQMPASASARVRGRV